jgi:hypothetical protein
MVQRRKLAEEEKKRVEAVKQLSAKQCVLAEGGGDVTLMSRAGTLGGESGGGVTLSGGGGAAAMPENGAGGEIREFYNKGTLGGRGRGGGVVTPSGMLPGGGVAAALPEERAGGELQEFYKKTILFLSYMTREFYKTTTNNASLVHNSGVNITQSTTTSGVNITESTHSEIACEKIFNSRVLTHKNTVHTVNIMPKGDGVEGKEEGVSPNKTRKRCERGLQKGPSTAAAAAATSTKISSKVCSRKISTAFAFQSKALEFTENIESMHFFLSVENVPCNICYLMHYSWNPLYQMNYNSFIRKLCTLYKRKKMKSFIKKLYMHKNRNKHNKVMREYMREYRKEYMREYLRENHRAYRKKHRREYLRQYLRAYRKKYNTAAVERLKKYHKEWYQKKKQKSIKEAAGGVVTFWGRGGRVGKAAPFSTHLDSAVGHGNENAGRKRRVRDARCETGVRWVGGVSRAEVGGGEAAAEGPGGERGAGGGERGVGGGEKLDNKRKKAAEHTQIVVLGVERSSVQGKGNGPERESERASERDSLLHNTRIGGLADERGGGWGGGHALGALADERGGSGLADTSPSALGNLVDTVAAGCKKKSDAQDLVGRGEKGRTRPSCLAQRHEAAKPQRDFLHTKKTGMPSKPSVCAR